MISITNEKNSSSNWTISQIITRPNLTRRLKDFIDQIHRYQTTPAPFPGFLGSFPNKLLAIVHQQGFAKNGGVDFLRTILSPETNSRALIEIDSDDVDSCLIDAVAERLIAPSPAAASLLFTIGERDGKTQRSRRGKERGIPRG